MGQNTRREPQDLVRDRTHLETDIAFATELQEVRVLVEGEAVADAFGAEEDGVEEVFVGSVAVAEGLAGVEEEWEVDVFEAAVFAEPEEVWEVVFVRAAEVFLADEVEAWGWLVC